MSHQFSSNLVLTISRTANAPSIAAMEDYMRSLVHRFPELTTNCEVDLTVAPVPCGESTCVTCNTAKSVLRDLSAANLHEWLEAEAIAQATPGEILRLSVNKEDELRWIARRILFAPFDRFTRRVKRWADAVTHLDDCTGPDVMWSVVPQREDRHMLTVLELETVRLLQAAAQEAAQHEWLKRSVKSSSPTLQVLIEIRTHDGRCRGCKEVRDVDDNPLTGYYEEHAALVSIQWAGRTLSREYRL